MKATKSILITGASSGIGEALALHYAADGVSLALTGRNRERLEAVAEKCRARGADVSPKIIDVADKPAMQLFINELDDARPLDLVIANAGVGLPGKDLSAGEIAEKTFAINVNGVFNTIHPALECMKARNGGQIAINSSVSALVGMPGAPAYSASKAAVLHYGEALRGVYAHRGIRINVICPGFVRTRMTAGNRFKMPFLMDSERAARIIARGLAKDKGVIGFPWQTYAAVRLLEILPRGFTGSLLRRSPRKARHSAGVGDG